jgi:hypothetical protein
VDRAAELVQRQQAQRVAHQHGDAGRRRARVAQAAQDDREGRQAEVGLRLAAAGGEEEQVHHVAVRVWAIGERAQVHQQERELERPPLLRLDVARARLRVPARGAVGRPSPSRGSLRRNACITIGSSSSPRPASFWKPTDSRACGSAAAMS